MEIDRSLLQGLRFECVKGCGVCCSFRPQLGDFEVERAKKAPEVATNVVEETDPGGEKEYYLRLKETAGRVGTCTFLDEQRRCGIWPQRFFKCHLYPFYLRFGDGISFDADLACAGFWHDGGRPAPQLASESLKATCGWDGGRAEGFPENPCGRMLGRIERDARLSFTQFCMIADGLGLMVPKGACRDAGSKTLHLMLTSEGLETIFSAAGNNPQAMTLGDFLKEAKTERGLVENLSSQLLQSSFQGRQRAADHPLFMTPDSRWEIFSLDGIDIVTKVFDETGKEIEIGRKRYVQPKLHPLPDDARRLLQWYLGFLNARQSTYDFSLINSSDSQAISVLSSYIQSLALFATETWSMAALYCYVKGRNMDGWAMQKGIQAVDNARVTGPSFDVI